MGIERLAVCAMLATVTGCSGAVTSAPSARSVEGAASAASTKKAAGSSHAATAEKLVRAARSSPSGAAEGKSAAKAKKAGDASLVGEPAPGFSVPAVANARGALELEDLRGKVVLVEFWGTSCEPCKKSFPRLQALYAKYRARGLKIVAISEDERGQKARIPAFAGESGASFMIGWDEDRSAANAYQAETPSSFLVDRDGVVRFARASREEVDDEELDKKVRQLLDP